MCVCTRNDPASAAPNHQCDPLRPAAQTSSANSTKYGYAAWGFHGCNMTHGPIAPYAKACTPSAPSVSGSRPSLHATQPVSAIATPCNNAEPTSVAHAAFPVTNDNGAMSQYIAG